MATALIVTSRTAVLARGSGLHPDLVKRLVQLGAIDREPPLSDADAAAWLARCERLRHDLGLNYAGAILACQLLARIDELEARLRLYER
jgi:gluconate kinase